MTTDGHQPRSLDPQPWQRSRSHAAPDRVDERHTCGRGRWRRPRHGARPARIGARPRVAADRRAFVAFERGPLLPLSPTLACRPLRIGDPSPIRHATLLAAIGGRPRSRQVRHRCVSSIRGLDRASACDPVLGDPRPCSRCAIARPVRRPSVREPRGAGFVQPRGVCRRTAIQGLCLTARPIPTFGRRAVGCPAPCITRGAGWHPPALAPYHIARASMAGARGGSPLR